MTSNGRFFLRGALICVALAFGFVEAARANFLDDIGDFFSGNAPEVASSAQCNSYAKAAVNVANSARRLNCPLTGPRYGTDEKGHYWWCMGVTPETSRAEENARNRQQVTCVDYESKCDAYGFQASGHAYDNRLYNCGFSGPRWGEDPEGHRNYCLSEKIMQVDRGETSTWPDAETSTRSEMIYQCKGQYSKKQVQFCNRYANEAVANAKIFKEKRCDRSQNSSGRWDTDYAPHFQWCIRSGPWPDPTTARAKAAINSANAEREISNAAVAACIAQRNRPPSAITRDLSEFTKTTPSNPPSKPTPKGNSGPGTGGAYLSKPIDGNSAMDRLGGGGGASGGSSSGVSTSRPSPRPSGGGSSGVSTSKPSGGSSSGISTSKPISPPSGGSSSGVYLSKPVSPPSGGSSSGVYLSKPGR